MSTSAFNFPKSKKALTLLCLGLSQTASALPQHHSPNTPRDSPSYALDTSYAGETFFKEFNFFTGTDPTQGFVDYVAQDKAEQAGLISQTAGAPARMSVDSKNPVQDGARGRQSVRVSTKKSWTHGLFIGDIAHMPDSTCGVWPAFWSFGPNWPASGEIDILENAGTSTTNKMSLHTAPGCQMTKPGPQKGLQASTECDGLKNGNEGCGVKSDSAVSYGSGFNSVGGGVYAMDWTSDHIKVWFFAKADVPADITSGKPNPAGWGEPQSAFIGSDSCNIDEHFKNHNIIINTTLCGQWAGGAWKTDPKCSALAPTCEEYVAKHPEAFKNAYWDINSVKVYQAGGAGGAAGAGGSPGPQPAPAPASAPAPAN